MMICFYVNEISSVRLLMLKHDYLYNYLMYILLHLTRFFKKKFSRFYISILHLTYKINECFLGMQLIRIIKTATLLLAANYIFLFEINVFLILTRTKCACLIS